MKAALFTKYGGPQVIQIGDKKRPEIKENEILIRTAATTVTGVDNIFRGGKALFARMATGIFSPKIPVLGTELSGIVEQVGDEVNRLRPGDNVIADSGTKYGAHAEYVVLTDKDPVVLKPDNISFEEGAALSYGALTAYAFLHKTAGLKQGQRILILGASGSVGSYALQLAKYMGAEVAAVSGTSNIEMLSELGANQAIDYKTTDIEKLSGNYNVIFDAVGKYSFSGVKHLLSKDGLYMTTDLSFGILRDMILTSVLGKRKAVISFTGLRDIADKQKDLELITDLVAKGVIRPVIDKVYPFEEIQSAHAHVNTGRKKGNVVVKLNNGDEHAGS